MRCPERYERTMNRRIFIAGVLLAGTQPRWTFADESQTKGTDEKPATDLVQLLRVIDERQRNQGDWRSLAYLEQRSKDKVTIAYEVLVLRRSSEQQFMMLFTGPKSSRGQGYLRVENNLWFYDPTVGKWERRTERERIGGTNSRRSDFDESRLAEDYDPDDGGREKLGKFSTRILRLTSKPGIDVAFPKMTLWVDEDSQNVLKRQEYSLSGKLLRTAYFPHWTSVHSESQGRKIWYPSEARMYDELEEGNSTILKVKSVDLRSLPANVFTKAWLESKSR